MQCISQYAFFALIEVNYIPERRAEHNLNKKIGEPSATTVVSAMCCVGGPTDQLGLVLGLT